MEADRIPAAAGPGAALVPLAAPAEGAPLEVRRPGEAPVVVSHVVDFYRRYPGEALTFMTQVTARRALPGFRLQVSLPAGVVLLPQDGLDVAGPLVSELVFEGESRYIIWNFDQPVRAGQKQEFEIPARVLPTLEDLLLESQARVTPLGAGDRPPAHTETVTVLVSAKGRYIRHLPRMYLEQDELMGRFLMLFESFWGPIEQQIDNLYDYFDPLLTPARLLPWLAGWVDLTLDERWPEAQRRRLLRSAVSLYRKRGTRRGLQEYLEIYTGGRVKITEHSASNFRLGPEARLGLGVALGTVNLPHTFTVTVFLPAGDARMETRARQAADHRRIIEAIIEAEKPAHTSYNLRVEYLS